MKFALSLIALVMLCISALGQDQTKDVSLLIKDQRALSKILIDYDTVKLVKKGDSVKLNEGYDLVLSILILLRPLD